MPKAEKYAKTGQKVSGPAGTASQRASKQTEGGRKISGRESTASSRVIKGQKLPDSQGT